LEESIEEIIISNEDDAFSLLQTALANKITDTAKVTFKGWPIFNLTIEGKDFNSSIPTRIMPPILDLQKEIHRIYCKAKYNSEDTRKLTDEERELLELVVTINPGSTKFFTDLFNALNEIVKNSNMNGPQVLSLLIAISFILATSIGWKDWLSAKEREHGQDISVRLSEQETERLKLVTEVLSRTPELQQNKEAISNFQSSISKRLKPSDQIKINDEPIINGTRAAEIVPAPKETSKGIRLDGDYRINEVKFPTKFGGEYRFSVTRLTDEKTFMVDAAPDVLKPEHIEILKEGSFSIKYVSMQINAREHRGHITDANIVYIDWPSKN
jgi:hypothetical protein